MIHRMSSLFVRTLRDNPVDAEVPSHRLLVRAGYIRRAAPGAYTWLPLGWRTFQRVENIIRQEMDSIGAQEVHFLPSCRVSHTKPQAMDRLRRQSVPT